MDPLGDHFDLDDYQTGVATHDRYPRVSGEITERTFAFPGSLSPRPVVMP